MILAVSAGPLRAEAELGHMTEKIYLEGTAKILAVPVQPDHDLSAVLVDRHRVISLWAHPSTTVRAKEAEIAVADTNALKVPISVPGTDAIASSRARLRGVVTSEVQACIPNSHANSVTAAIVRACRPLTGRTRVALEALTDSGASVTNSSAAEVQGAGRDRIARCCVGGDREALGREENLRGLAEAITTYLHSV